jgi:hypothetical protein
MCGCAGRGDTFVPLAHPPGHAKVDFGEAVGAIRSTGTSAFASAAGLRWCGKTMASGPQPIPFRTRSRTRITWHQNCQRPALTDVTHRALAGQLRPSIRPADGRGHRPAPNLKRLRKAAGLSQEKFALEDRLQSLEPLEPQGHLVAHPGGAGRAKLDRRDCERPAGFRRHSAAP